MKDLPYWLLQQYNLGYYTVFTTTINILIGVFIYLLLRYIFVKKKIDKYVKENQNLIFKGIFSWVLLGTSIRLLKDLKMVSGFATLFVVTPFIYVETLFLSLLVFFLVKNKNIWVIFPFLFSLPILLFEFSISNTFRAMFSLYTILLWILLSLPGLFFFRDNITKISFSSQMLDGVTTFMSITFLGFGEEHIVPNFLMTYVEKFHLLIFGSGAWIFLITKFAIISLILWWLEKEEINIVDKLLLYLFIFTLGIAVGLRNLLNIMVIG